MAITKKTSYSPEQQVPVGPPWPNKREWASPSYDSRTGLPAQFNRKGARQVPNAGRHTTGNGAPSTKPGRW